MFGLMPICMGENEKEFLLLLKEITTLELSISKFQLHSIRDSL